jgi:hypothetical protein
MKCAICEIEKPHIIDRSTDELVECAICQRFICVDCVMQFHHQEVMFSMLGDNEYVCDDCDHVDHKKKEKENGTKIQN